MAADQPAEPTMVTLVRRLRDVGYVLAAVVSAILSWRTITLAAEVYLHLPKPLAPLYPFVVDAPMLTWSASLWLAGQDGRRDHLGMTRVLLVVYVGLSGAFNVAADLAIPPRVLLWVTVGMAALPPVSYILAFERGAADHADRQRQAAPPTQPTVAHGDGRPALSPSQVPARLADVRPDAAGPSPSGTAERPRATLERVVDDPDQAAASAPAPRTALRHEAALEVARRLRDELVAEGREPTGELLGARAGGLSARWGRKYLQLLRTEDQGRAEQDDRSQRHDGEREAQR